MSKVLGSSMAFRIVRGSAALLLVAAVFHPTGASAVAGTTFYVGTTSDENDLAGNDCETQGNDTCSLREAIIAANANDNSPVDTDTIQVPGDLDGTYILTRGGSFEGGVPNEGTGDLDITENVEIDAPGDPAIVDASGLEVCDEGCTPAPDRVFQIHQVTVTLSGLTIQGGSAEEGGGISNNGGNLTVENSVVTGNEASDGGGIYAGNPTTVPTTTLDNSSVERNTASSEGGGIYNGSGDFLYVTNGSQVRRNQALLPDGFGGNGGGIYNAGHTEVTNSTIGGDERSGNLAQRAGGGIYTNVQTPGGSTLIVEDSDVSWNSAGNDGGGIYNFNDRTELIGANVTQNTAGAAIDPPGAPVQFIQFGGNGGGVYSSAEGNGDEDSPGLYISESTEISENIARACVSTDGVLDCEAGDQPPTGNGGGIWTAGHAEIGDSLVGANPDLDDPTEGNRAKANGGGIYVAIPFNELTTLIENSSIFQNSAAFDGGGIYNEGDHLALDGVTVEENTAGQLPDDDLTGGAGGGIWNGAPDDAPSCDPQTENDCPGLYTTSQDAIPTVINRNVALQAPCVESVDCSTPQEFSSGNGGGVYNQGHTEITDGTMVGDPNSEFPDLDGNFADREGGGIWTTSFGDGGPCDIDCPPCDIDCPPCDIDCDGCDVCTLIVDESFVQGNGAGLAGGGIYNEFDRVEITDSTVMANVAGAGEDSQGGFGGGIWNGAQAFAAGPGQPGLYIDHSDILENWALWDFCRCEIGEGGGIWNGGHAELSNDTHVDDNIAQQTGGGIWTQGCAFDCCPEGCGTLILSDTTVSGNTAAFDGGGIWNGVDAVTLERTTVSYNRAGVYVAPCQVECEGPTTEQVAGGNGGGVYSEVSEGLGFFHAENTTVSRNTAFSGDGSGGFGGGLYLAGNPAGDLHSLTVTENEAGAGGNLALNVEGPPEPDPSTVSITNTIVTAGTADGSLDNCFIGPNNDIESLGYNLTDEEAQQQGPPPCDFDHMTDLLDTDPMLGDLLLNPPGLTETHALPSGSPAVDSGASAVGELCLEEDQRTVPRPQGANCDRGAYELLRSGGGDPGGGSPSADLSIVKTASPSSVEPGDQLVYTLTVKNLGPGSATGVVVTDTLPASETFVFGSTTKGSCEHVSGTVTCNLGTLALNEVVTITITVDVNAAGELVNTASVTGTAPDPNQPNNRSSATATGEASGGANCAGVVNDPRLEILGTPAADLIIGTDADEVICGKDGDDTILGGAGDDGLYGEGDDDYLSGGPGDDTLVGGPGSDWGNYSGAPGSVDADLERGTAIGEGATGRDTSSDQGANTDELEGIENLIGSQFPDRLAGDGGRNELLGKSGADLMLGRGADDILRGNRGNDLERGGSGNDLVRGGFDEDQLLGGTGNDRVTGGQQNDRVIGNKGDDSLRGGGADDHLNGKAGTDTCRGGQPHNTYESCER